MVYSLFAAVAFVASAVTAQKAIDTHTQNWVEFDGTSDRATIPTITLDTDLTFEVVYQHHDVENWARVFQFEQTFEGTGSYIGLLKDSQNTNGNRVFFEIGVRQADNTLRRYALRQQTFDMKLDTWHHMIVTLKTTGDAEMWADSLPRIMKGKFDVGYPTGSFTTNALSSDSGNLRHRGSIALFRLYNKALSATEINAAFANADVPTALQSNLKIEYKFEGQFGNIIEDTAGDLDATMIAFPLWKTVKPRALTSISRTAVRFLDFNDQAQLPEMSMPGGDMTFETVFRFLDEFEAYDRVFSLRKSQSDATSFNILKSNAANGYFMYFEYAERQSDGKMRYYNVNTQRVASQPYVWQHMIVTMSKTGDVKMYINGSVVGVRDNFPAPVPAYDVKDGAISSAGKSFTGSEHNGDIARVRVYDKVLTEADIKAAFEQEYAVLEETPILEYRMNEGMGTTLAERSPKKYNAVFSGYPLWYDVRMTQRLQALGRNYAEFDGVGDSLAVDAVNIKESFAVEIAFRVDWSTPQSNWPHLLQMKTSTAVSDRLAVLRHGTTGRVYCEVVKSNPAEAGKFFYYSSYGNSVVLEDGFHHLVWSMDKDKNGYLYIDGSLTSKTNQPFDAGNYAAVSIGGSVTGGNTIKADIPLVRFYSSSLTDNEVTGLFKSSILSYNKEVFAGFSINQPSAFSKVLNSYEFIGDSSTTSVTDVKTGKTFNFRGNPEFRQEIINGCSADNLVEVTLETATNQWSDSVADIWTTLLYTDGTKSPMDMTFPKGLSLGQVATGFRCLGSGKTLKALQLDTTSTDGYRAALFVVRVGNEAHVFQESFFLDFPALPTKVLDLSDSVVAKATSCETNETPVTFITRTSTRTYSDGSGEAKVVIKGATKDSPALTLGTNFQLGEVRQLTRCAPADIGDIQGFTLSYNSVGDGWRFDTFEAAFNDGTQDQNYTWQYGTYMKKNDGFDRAVTFTIGDHEDVAGSDCPANQLVSIWVKGTGRVKRTLSATMSGTGGDALPVRLIHDYSTADTRAPFVRCLTQSIGKLSSMLLSVQATGVSTDTFNFTEATVVYLGAEFKWTSTGSPISDTQSVTLQAADSSINPAEDGSTTAKACAENVCADGAACEEKRTWKRMYNANFSTDADGWLSDSNTEDDSQSTPVTCGSLGPVLGITQMAAGDTLSRTTTGLATHSLLRLQMTLVKGDSFDNEYLIAEVDGTVVYSTAESGGTGTQECGNGQDYARESLHSFDIIIPHTASSVTVLVRTNLNGEANDESFGIQKATVWVVDATQDNVIEDTFTVDSVPSGWNALNTFNDVALSVKTCGDYGPILGGYQQLGVEALLYKCFDTTTPHTELIIDMEVVAVDSFDGENVFVMVDGVQVWASPNVNRATHPVGSFECGQQPTNDNQWWWREVRIPIKLRVVHTASSAQILINTNTDGNAADESFAVSKFKVTATNVGYTCAGADFTPGSGPTPAPVTKTPFPAPTASCADYPEYPCSTDDTCTLSYSWTELPNGKGDFTDGTAQSWTAEGNPSCNGLSVTTCGDFGQVLGGNSQLVRGSSLSRQWTNLGSHNKVWIRLNLLTIDSWDREYLYIDVDGEEAYRVGPIFRDAGDEDASHQCGWNNGAQWTREKMFSASFQAYHIASDLSIRIRSNLDEVGRDESWALSSYAIATADTSNKLNVPAAVPADASRLASLWDSTGGKEIDTCLSTPSGSASYFGTGAVDQQLFRTYYNLPAHDLLQLDMVVAADPNAEVIVSVDGVLRAVPVSAMGSPEDCANGRKRATVKIIVPHDSATARVRLSGSAEYGLISLAATVNESPLQCSCQANEYSTADNHECVACDLTCATCNGSTSGDCLSCSGDFFLDQSRCVACSGCDANEYQISECTNVQDTSCGTCNEACSSCLDSTLAGCTGCATGFARDDQGVCRPECEAGQRLDSVAGVCVACSSDCDECTATACTRCGQGFFLDASKACSATCPRGTYADTSSGSCVACENGCADCSGAGGKVCNECSSDRATFITGGVRLCLVRCVGGYFENGVGNCQQCDVCPAGQYADRACSSNLNTGCRNCSTCSERQFAVTTCNNLEDTSCADCHRSCGSCFGPATSECKTCASSSDCLQDDSSCAPCDSNTQASRSSSSSSSGVPIWVIIAIAIVAVAAIVAAVVYRKKSQDNAGPAPQSSISFRPGAFSNPIYGDNGEIDPAYMEPAVSDAANPAYSEPAFSPTYDNHGDGDEAGYMETSAFGNDDNFGDFGDGEGDGDEAGYLDVDGEEGALGFD
eukprot:m.268897 g.268897  ORF g.268897 m.268897 type:complete len:2269 (+) comp17659_c0_seq1:97-6903(+)